MKAKLFSAHILKTSLFFSMLLLPFQAHAIQLLPSCYKSGNCGITDILVVFVNVAEFLLGVVGAVALVFFIYGGFLLITSGGNDAQVQKGKDTIRNAVIGIAVIFLSGTIVRFTTDALRRGKSEIHIVGESCTTVSGAAAGGASFTGKAGIYVTIPAGVGDKNNAAGTLIKEDVICVAKDNCQHLQALFTARNRTEKFECINVTGQNVRSCVRGLCPSKGADYACCLTK